MRDAVKMKPVPAASRSASDRGPLSPLALAVAAIMLTRPSLDAVLGAGRIALGPLQLSGGFIINLLLVGLAAGLSVHALIVRRAADAAVVGTAVVWLPFLAAAAFAAAHSPKPVEAAQVLFNYATFAAVALLALLVTPQLGRERLTFVVVASGILPIAWALGQQVGIVPVGWADPAIYGGLLRVTGTFTHPNILAFFLQVYVAFLFHALLSNYVGSAAVRMMLWSVVALALGVLLLTGTRAAFVGTYVFILGYSLLRRPLLLLPALLIPPLALLVPGVADRIADVTGGAPAFSYDYVLSVARGDVAGSSYVSVDSGMWRRYLWQAAWPWVEQRPWLGWGLASFPFYALEFFSTLGLEGGTYAHNTFLQLLFEGGAVLLAGFVWTLVGSAVQHLSNQRYGRGEAVFALLLVVSYALGMASDNMLFYLSADLQFFFLLFALKAIGGEERRYWQTRGEARRHEALRERRAARRTARAGLKTSVPSA